MENEIMDSVKCICCGFEIKRLHADMVSKEDKPEVGMWDGGTVERIGMPYGSKLDGDIYIIGICDGCIKKNKDRVIYKGDYLMTYGEQVESK